MSKQGKTIVQLFQDYQHSEKRTVRANPSAQSQHEQFTTWLKRKGYNPLKISEDDWVALFISFGGTAEDAEDYLAGIAEQLSMSKTRR